MVTVRKLLISASLLVLAAGAARAQMPSFLAPPPITGTVGPTTLDDRNDHILVGNPYLDGPRCDLGWFTTVDIGFDGSHVTSQLSAPVAVGGAAHTVDLPSSPLNWTASPRFEVGYRFGEAAGELILSYRFLDSYGTQSTPAFDTAGNPGLLRSRLAINVIDLDYACQENALAPWADIKWRFGVRGATLFFDSAEKSPLLFEHENNYFGGAGPHVALDLWFPAESHFAFYCKLDGAGVFGTVLQNFEETMPGPLSGATHQQTGVPTTMFNVQAGLAWAPSDTFRFTLGYTYEIWWDAMFISLGGSRGDVWTQGLFLRGEWRY